jgi:glycosyltransferase involved in cell wall biosynthesis
LHVIKNLGGAETNLLNLIKASDPRRVEIHVAYSSGGEIEQRFRQENLRLFRYARRDHKIKSFATPGIVFRLARYLETHDIDIVHTHNFNAHVWGCLAAKLAGCKLVEHVHDFRYLDREEFKRRKGSVFQYQYIKYFKNLSDRVVVLTRQNVDYLVSKGYYPITRVREIRNGIPLVTCEYSKAKTRAALGIDPDALVVLTSARISAEKNIGLILDMVPEVAREIPKVQFVIAGDGPQRVELEARVRTENLSANVRFIGFYEDIHELLNSSDVFLLPSFLELHSIAILEALSMKVPVLASRDVGCNSEIFQEGRDGFLLDPFSVHGWAGTVLKLLKDPVLRRSVGESGYELCRRSFDIRQVAGKFEHLYEELLGVTAGD